MNTAADSPILVVDDDPNYCTLLSKLLARRHYQVDVAHDGSAALDLVAHRPYRLALIDYRMPEMGGVELYRRIHELQPEMVGVFVTGYPTIDTVYPQSRRGWCGSGEARRFRRAVQGGRRICGHVD